MAKRYRALISVPISAETDDDACSAAVEYANSLRDQRDTIVGHLELLGETRESIWEIIRVVDADPKLVTQLPPDWKPEVATAESEDGG